MGKRRSSFRLGVVVEGERETDSTPPRGPKFDSDPSRGALPFAEPLVRGRLAELGAIVSGCLYFVSFAGFDQSWLTFVALVPLILSMQGQTTKRATWLGFLAGLSMNLGGFYWLTTMLQTFSGFPTPLCILFVVIICSYQGGRLALFGWLYGRATNRGWKAHLVFAGAFAASELVYPLLFPWYYAATIHTIPVLMQGVELAGPILVSLLLVSINLAIAEPIRARIQAARDKASKLVPRHPINPRIIGVAVISTVAALLFGTVRMSMTKSKMESSPEVKVGFVQGNMGLMQKREDPGEGLRRHRRLTAELKNQGTDLVVWSESSVTFAVPEDMATKGHFFRDRFAASLGVPTIFGAVLFRVDPDRERWFNTAIATDAKGEFTGRYDKQYLLAFGEYLPFGDTFPILYKWSPHSGRFTPGTAIEPIEVDIKGEKHKVSVLVCYEDILPGFTNRAVSHADPEMLINITNDAWFGDTTEPYEHLALAKFRAIEHRRYLVRSTNSGVSAIVDPNGRVMTQSKTFVAEAKQATLHWMRGGTVYETVGDLPWYLTTIAIVVCSFRRKREKAAGSAAEAA